MSGGGWRAFLPELLLLPMAAAVAVGTGALLSGTMPPWRDSVGDQNYTEKITGTYLVEESAQEEDTLLIFGSSELRTTQISTHPANFFAGKRAGFQVDLIGRGSCQSLIHALQIAASGDSLQGKKVVLITSPQSYVPEGIAPDLFMANFSYEQYLALLEDEDLSDQVKEYLSGRVEELMAQYREMDGASPVDPAVELLADSRSGGGPLSAAAAGVLAPYYRASGYLWELKDLVDSRRLLEKGTDVQAPDPLPVIHWEEEEAAAQAEGEAMSSNNEFWMLNDYYTTYIGSRLERQKNQDAHLDYSVSKEYDDLRVLFETCREKGIDPLFVHVPLHGPWSDYTGFTADRREAYYQNVREIAADYGISMLDLTGYENEPYFMCDVMYLGWKGWLAVDRALIDYYYGL